MPKRIFVCNKHRTYSIRNNYFVGGKFETEDPEVIKLFVNADGYGRDGPLIVPAETVEELVAMKKEFPELVPESLPGFEDDPVLKPGPLLAPSVFGLREVDSEEEEPAPIAVRGARGTGSTRGQRRAHVIKGKE